MRAPYYKTHQRRYNLASASNLTIKYMKTRKEVKQSLRYMALTAKTDMQNNAMDWLKKNIKKEQEIYAMVTKVSSSGMSRKMKFLTVIKNKALKSHQITNITWYIAIALDYKRNDDGTLKIGGCGMDMGYHVVSQLASILGYTDKKLGAQSGGNCYGLNHRQL